MIVGVIGDLDLSSVPTVRSASIELSVDGWRHIVVDLAGVDFIDSAGMGTLIGLRRRCRAEGGDCVLAAASPTVLRALESADLDQIFRIFGSLEEARRALGGARR